MLTGGRPLSEHPHRKCFEVKLRSLGRPVPLPTTCPASSGPMSAQSGAGGGEAARTPSHPAPRDQGKAHGSPASGGAGFHASPRAELARSTWCRPRWGHRAHAAEGGRPCIHGMYASCCRGPCPGPPSQPGACGEAVPCPTPHGTCPWVPHAHPSSLAALPPSGTLLGHSSPSFSEHSRGLASLLTFLGSQDFFPDPC